MDILLEIYSDMFREIHIKIYDFYLPRLTMIIILESLMTIFIEVYFDDDI